jgi:hypothetical protein
MVRTRVETVANYSEAFSWQLFGRTEENGKTSVMTGGLQIMKQTWDFLNIRFQY